MSLPANYLVILELLGLFSVITFLGSLIAIPYIIARLPTHFFISHRQKVEARHARHPALAVFIFVFRNTIGTFFLLAGIAMLVLPGQGIITILIGLSFIDFPRKHEVVDRLVRMPRVVSALNWIRQREKREPFVF